MRVVLSIRPEFSTRIFDGTKRFEYRRVVFRRPVKTVYVYESSPTKQIVGTFSVGAIHSGSPESIWESTHAVSGIDQDEFFRYFSNCDIAYAIEVLDATRLDEPLPLSALYSSPPPQSFGYIAAGAG